VSRTEQLDVHLIYGPHEEKKRYWKKWTDYFERTGTAGKSLVIGDLNEVITPNVDRLDNTSNETTALAKMVNRTGLIDHYRFLHNDERRYTFIRNYREDRRCNSRRKTSASRIDHSLIGASWANIAETEIKDLDLNLSPDHAAVITTIKIEGEVSKITDRVEPPTIILDRINVKRFVESKDNSVAYQAQLRSKLDAFPEIQDTTQPANGRYNQLIDWLADSHSERLRPILSDYKTKIEIETKRKSDGRDRQ